MSDKEKALIDDLAWWVKEQFDECPLVFMRASQWQERLEKKYKEYRNE